MDFAVVLLLFFEGISLARTQNVMCPGDFVVTAQPGKAYAEVQWSEPSVLPPHFLTYKSHCPGELPLGTTNVTYEYSSLIMGRVLVIESCSFKVNVMAADSEPPVVSGCPSSPINRTFEVGLGGIIATWTEPSATDNSGQVEFDSNVRSGEDFYLSGSPKRFPIFYTFQDPTGNKAYCNFEIHFIAVDTTPPNVRNCPGQLVQEVPLGVMGTTVSWRFPSVNDNSGQLTWTMDPLVPDNFFSLGTHHLIFNFTDPSGNSAICVTFVQVVSRDLTPPEIVFCPSSIIVGVPPGVDTTEVDWFQPEAIDNSGRVFLDFQSDFPGVYAVNTTLEITYIFRDFADNEAICRFVIRVIEDEEPPAIFGCPTEGIQRFVKPGQAQTNVLWTEPFGLDETSAKIIYQSHYPEDEFVIGNTTVTYIFEDSAENSANCTFNVRVSIMEDDPTEVASTTIAIVVVVCAVVLVVTLILVIGATVCWFQRIDRSVKSGPYIPEPAHEADNEGFYSTGLYSELDEQERQSPSTSAGPSQVISAEYFEMEPVEKDGSDVKPS